MFSIPIEVFRRFDRKAGWVMSSHVAMSMMLALFPFIIYIVALAGLLTRNVDQGQLIALTMGSWPDAVAGPIERELRAVVASGSVRLLSFSGLLALFFASNGIDAIEQAMTLAYDTEETRPFWKRRLIAIVFVIVGATAIVVLTFLGVVLPLYFHFIDETSHWLFEWLFESPGPRMIIGMVVAGLAVVACHEFLPDGKPRGWRVWPGATLTVLAWALAAHGFGIYLARFGKYAATYAGLAGAMAALIFLYLMAAILILGAEFNGVLAERQARRAGEQGAAAGH